MSLPVPLYALVIEEQRRTTRNGKSFWQNQLKTSVGMIKSNIWDIPDDAETNLIVPHAKDIIVITSFKDDMAEHQSIAIKDFRRIVKDSLPEEAKGIVEVEKADPKKLNEAIALIWDNSFWENPKHHEFVLRCIKKLDVEKLKMCPAASKIHHRMSGGLLIHTAEVLRLCRAIVESSTEYEFINRDVLYGSSILHDLGKVFTYSINELGIATSSLAEKTIGHLFYSVNLIESTYLENKDMVEKWFVEEIMHCTAAHHGDPEFGSLKKTQSIEAGILAKVDYISARNGMVDAMLKDNVKSGQGLQESFSVYGDQYFASQGMKNYMEKL